MLKPKKQAKATKRTRKSTKPLSHRGPDARMRAWQLLAEGVTATAAAREIGVDRSTVTKWRDSLEGQAYLSRVRIEREKQFLTVREDAGRALREAAQPAVSILYDSLQSKVPFEALAAARDILDRTGVLRGEQVITKQDSIDLSKLTVEEIAELERLQAKGARG